MSLYVVFQYGGRAPLGRLLAEGIPLDSARELATRSNWRIRVVVRELRRERRRLREAVPSRERARRHTNQYWDEASVVGLRRRVAELEWALRALLAQRARARRVRGLQCAFWFDDGELSRLLAEIGAGAP